MQLKKQNYKERGTNSLWVILQFFVLVLACIRLNEDDTTSPSRVFIKILFQELAEYMGLPKLNERLKDPFLAEYFEGIFPHDNPRNTRFSINFFTSIGLGGVTDELREHLKNAPKMIMGRVTVTQILLMKAAVKIAQAPKNLPNLPNSHRKMIGRKGIKRSMLTRKKTQESTRKDSEHAAQNKLVLKSVVFTLGSAVKLTAL